MPISILSKTLQNEEIDILEALTSVLRTLKELDKLLSKPVEQWATYKTVIQKCDDEVYQLQDIKSFSVATQYFKNNGDSYCRKVSDCVKSRLRWSDIEMMRAMIVILNPQGWEKLLSQNDDSLDEINTLIRKFETPLMGAGAIVDDIQKQFVVMIEFASE